MQNYNEYLFCNTVTKVFSVLFYKQGTHFEMTEGNSIMAFSSCNFPRQESSFAPRGFETSYSFFIELQDTGGKDQF